MTHIQSRFDVPENYVYNKYNFKKASSGLARVDVNIDDYVCELMQYGSDRDRFEEIMSSLEKKFMDGENLSSEDEMRGRDYSKFNKYEESRDNSKFSQNQIEFRTNKNDYGNAQNNNSHHNNFRPINNLYADGSSIRIDNNQDRDFIQNSLLPKKPFTFIQKKYTDVHANSKYHYPHNYYEDIDDLSLDKSQWTDRANTSIFYSKQNNNISYTSNAYSPSIHDHDEKYNKYPEKFNSLFLANKTGAEDSLRLNRENKYMNSDRSIKGKLI